MTDYKDAKAEAKANKARAKAMRPWFKKKRFIFGGLLLVLVIASVASGSGSDTDGGGGGDNDTPSGVNSDFSTNSDNPPEADVEIVSCAKTVIDTVEVALRVTNNSSKASDYTISIGIEDASGAKVGDGFASTSNVNPGQVANVEGFATLTGSPSSFKCVLEEVERFAS